MSYALEYQSMNDEINELFTNLQCVAYFMRLISDQQDAFTREVKSTCSNKKISFQRLPRVFSLTQELFHGKLPELIKSFSNIILKINPSLNSNEEYKESADPVIQMINLLKSYENHLSVEKFKTPMNSENSDMEMDTNSDLNDIFDWDLKMLYQLDPH